MAWEEVVPSEQMLVAELAELRRRGITRLAFLKTPALSAAVRAAGRAEGDEVVGAYMIEALLRDAVVQVGGDLGEAASVVLGLAPGGRSDRPSELRKLAAEVLHVVPDHFRRTWEPLIHQQIAQLVLAEVHRHRLHLARLRRDVRTPVGSRLAVEWLQRFETMYQIWTPVTGLGGDLTAYRSTLLDTERPWDKEPDPSDPEDDGYTQERQAAGYLTFAFFHYAHALWSERQFVNRFGGMWLLPDAQAETDLADAMFRIRLASPNNELDDSLLRRLVAQVPDQEILGVREAAKAEPLVMDLHREWQEWAATCHCEWDVGTRVGREEFPTHRAHPGISPHCDLHILVAACSDFCLILDDSWDQIADWYRDVPRPRRLDVTAEEVYQMRSDPLPGHERERERR